MRVESFVPFVISLRRSARLLDFNRRYLTARPVLTSAIEFNGIDGRALPFVPRWVARERAGAFGCFASHFSLWLRAFANGFAESGSALLVFEDDATFDDDFCDRFRAAVAELPDDFGLFYLGGQHMTYRRPIPKTFSDNLFKAVNVNRAHAYAVGPTALGELIARFWDDFSWGSRVGETVSGWPEGDFDHALGRLVERGVVSAYATRNPRNPSRNWICGQAAGVSENTGNACGYRRWELYGEAEN